MKSFAKRFLTFVQCAAIVCIFCHCDKDEGDTEGPRIIQQLPVDNQIFSTVDTIPFLAQITDNESVRFVEISVLDLNFIPVLPKTRINYGIGTVNFAFDYILDGALLESGSYVLGLTAGDSQNTTTSYRQVLLTAVERVIERYYVATGQSNNTVLFSGPNLASMSPALSLQMNLRGTALNYRQNIIGLVGGSLGDATFYATTDLEVKNNYPGFGNAAFPYFLGLEYSTATERFVILQNAPRLQILDQLSAPLSGVDLLPSYLPQQAWDESGYYFVDEKQVSGPLRFLTRYSYPGLRVASSAVPGKVVQVFRLSNDAVFVWVNAPGGTELSILNLESNLVQPVYQRPGESLKDAIPIAPNTFMISTSGGLYRYNYGNGGTAVLQSGYSPERLYYEEISGRFYATDGATLTALTPIGQIIESQDFPAPIKFVGFDYNR